MKIHLVSDVLDKQLVDARGQNAGRVDGIVLQLRDGLPPRVAYVEVGPITLLSRFSRRLAAWYARRDRGFGVGRGQPYRIPWTRVRRDKTGVRVDLDASETPINAVEAWLRRVVVERIPWS